MTLHGRRWPATPRAISSGCLTCGLRGGRTAGRSGADVRLLVEAPPTRRAARSRRCRACADDRSGGGSSRRRRHWSARGRAARARSVPRPECVGEEGLTSYGVSQPVRSVRWLPVPFARATRNGRPSARSRSPSDSTAPDHPTTATSPRERSGCATHEVMTPDLTDLEQERPGGGIGAGRTPAANGNQTYRFAAGTTKCARTTSAYMLVLRARRRLGARHALLSAPSALRNRLGGLRAGREQRRGLVLLSFVRRAAAFFASTLGGSRNSDDPPTS